MKAYSRYYSLMLFILVIIFPGAGILMAAAETVKDEWVPKPEAITGENLPRVPLEIMKGYEEYARIHPSRLLDLHPSGKGLIVSTMRGEDNAAQVYWQEQPLGPLRQLTTGEEPVFEACFSPNAKKNSFVYSRDAGGSEKYQLFRFDLDTQTSTLLTGGKAIYMGMKFDDGGNKLVYASNERTGTFFDLYIMDPFAPGSGKLIHTADKSAYNRPVCWFSDKRRLVFCEYISANQVNSYILDTETLTSENITPSSASPQVFAVGAVSGDNKYLFGVTDREGEFLQLFRMDIATREIRYIARDILWNISGNQGALFPVTPDKKHLAFLADEGGVFRVYLLNMETLAYHPLKGSLIGDIYGLTFSGSGHQLFMTVNTPQTCADVYAVALDSGLVTRWTKDDTAKKDLSKAVMPQLINYPTFDSINGKKRLIPAFYFPPVKKTGKPFPVLIIIHGGPESQYRPGFDAFESYLVNELGIALLAPNVRGSSGYGKSWLLLDNGEKREDSVKDIQGLLDWVALQPELDKNRVAVYGGSYGGYMTLASLVHYSDRLACGVDFVGISHFVTFLENTSGYRRDLRRAEYGDERKIGAFLTAISPAVNAHKIKKPLFVLQGKNDPRVPVTEALQIVATVRKNNVPVWYMEAANEGHGFNKKENENYASYCMIMFFREFLLK